MSTITSNYGLLKPELSDTADITAYNGNWDKIDEELSKLNVKTVDALSEDGISYHVTINGIAELYNGLEISIVPNVTNTANAPTINVNTLGAKAIRLSLSTNTSGTIPLPVSYLVEGRPVKLIYDSIIGMWKIANKEKTSANDLYGQTPISSGGTGAASAEEARENLEITPANIGALPTILVEGEHYGTEEQRPDAGTKGRIYFQVISG